MGTIFCDNCENEIHENEGINVAKTESAGKLIVCKKCEAYYGEGVK